MDERLNVYEEKMSKTLDNLNGELATIRAGRANPNVLNKLTVDYPDSAMGKEYAQRDRESDHDI